MNPDLLSATMKLASLTDEWKKEYPDIKFTVKGNDEHGIELIIEGREALSAYKMPFDSPGYTDFVYDIYLSLQNYN